MLDLSYNFISDIEQGGFSDLANCFEIWLDGNELQEIRIGSWAGPHALELLSMEGNKLTTVQDGNFSNLPHLHTLILQNNDMGKIWNSAGMEQLMC